MIKTVFCLYHTLDIQLKDMRGYQSIQFFSLFSGTQLSIDNRSDWYVHQWCKCMFSYFQIESKSFYTHWKKEQNFVSRGKENLKFFLPRQNRLLLVFLEGNCASSKCTTTWKNRSNLRKNLHFQNNSSVAI